MDKVKAALDTAVGILNDKDGWKVNSYLSHCFQCFLLGQATLLFHDFLQIDHVVFQGGKGEGWSDHQKQEKRRRQKGENEYFCPGSSLSTLVVVPLENLYTKKDF